MRTRLSISLRRPPARLPALRQRALAPLRYLRFARRVARRTGGFWTVLLQYRAVCRAALHEHRVPSGDVQEFGFLTYRLSCWRAHELKYLLEEVFERADYDFHTTHEAPLILDCGSNIGVSMLYFKHFWPAARIVCFEPDPACFDLLTRNIERNGLTGVQAHHAALTGDRGAVPFFQDRTRAGSLRGSLVRERARGGTAVLVQGHRLSDHLDGPVALLKLDVEGAEIAVLSDLTASGRWDMIENAVIEYHHNLPSAAGTLSGFLTEIERAGFTYQLTAHPGGSANWSGFQDILIRASRRQTAQRRSARS